MLRPPSVVPATAPDFQRHGAQHRFRLNPHQIVHTWKSPASAPLSASRPRGSAGHPQTMPPAQDHRQSRSSSRNCHRCGWEKVARLAGTIRETGFFSLFFGISSYRIYQRRRKVRRHRHAMCFLRTFASAESRISVISISSCSRYCL